MRRMLWAVVLLATGSAAMAGEFDDPLVCRREAVLARVTALLRQAGRPLALDPATAGEQSAGTARVVSCAVQGHLLGYETNRNAIQPIDTLFVVRYSLELRQNGIFLRLE